MKPNVFIKWVIYPLLLLFLWVILCVIYIVNSEKSPSVLPVHHASSTLHNYKSSQILKGESIKGRLKAEENFLGIISVRFDSKSDLSSDFMRFRIKEAGQKNWYYDHVYDARQFYFQPLYTFGFPIITDSKNKEYDIELVSLRGTPENSVNLDTQHPIVISKYKYPVKLLLTDPKSLLNFIIKKGVTVTKSIEFYFAVIFFSIPLVFYFAWQLRLNKTRWGRKISEQVNVLRLSQFNLSRLVLLIIVVSVFLISKIYDYVVIILAISWILCIYKYRINAKETLILAFIFLALSTGFAVFSMREYVDKAAVWAYIFILISIMQLVINSVPYKEILTVNKRKYAKK